MRAPPAPQRGKHPKAPHSSLLLTYLESLARSRAGSPRRVRAMTTGEAAWPARCASGPNLDKTKVLVNGGALSDGAIVHTHAHTHSRCFPRCRVTDTPLNAAVKRRGSWRTRRASRGRRVCLTQAQPSGGTKRATVPPVPSLVEHTGPRLPTLVPRASCACLRLRPACQMPPGERTHPRISRSPHGSPEPARASPRSSTRDMG